MVGKGLSDLAVCVEQFYIASLFSLSKSDINFYVAHELYMAKLLCITYLLKAEWSLTLK